MKLQKEDIISVYEMSLLAVMVLAGALAYALATDSGGLVLRAALVAVYVGMSIGHQWVGANMALQLHLRVKRRYSMVPYYLVVLLVGGMTAVLAVIFCEDWDRTVSLMGMLLLVSLLPTGVFILAINSFKSREPSSEEKLPGLQENLGQATPVKTAPSLDPGETTSAR